MSRHADAETLAAFREELLSRRKAAQVSAHLAVCPRCAGLDAQLAEVQALLTRSTAPPMPDALTARIEAAIAAEAAARAATAADGSVTAAPGAGAHARDGAAGPSGRRAGRAAKPPAGPRRSVLALRVAAVTAAVVVVAGGGYGVAKLLAGSPSEGTGASAARNIGAKGLPQTPAGGRQAPASGGGAAASGAAPTAQIVRSGTNYQPGRLKAQVSAVLARHQGNVTAGPGPGPSPGNRQAGAAQVPACVAQAARGTHPVLVDHASYQGRPATVIVVPAGPGTLRALVVAGDCTAATAHVLTTTTIPAPG